MGSAGPNHANGVPNGSSDDYEPINVVIPIGGIGSRFAKQGYRFPKPLINIVGRPMLLWLIENLSLKPKDSLWIAINEEVDDEFRVGQLVSKLSAKVDFRLLRLKHPTRGASETLYIVTQSMPPDVLSRKTVSLDCDTIYWADILTEIRQMPRGHGGCFYFKDHSGKPVFSYIKTEDGIERIVDIQEKKAISNNANTGAYVFPSARELRSWASRNLDQQTKNTTLVGEYYTSQLIAFMMQNGVPFMGLPVDINAFSCVGTPEQLQALLRQVKSTDAALLPPQIKKRRFCFDLDNTLVGVPEISGDYSTCPPIDKNIRLVQQLYNAGHYIIIQTARRMRTHKGNVGSVIADIGLVTLNQLAKYNIPYHDIHFGKPYADVYVDDLAVNANLDTMKEIGWLLDEPDRTKLIGPEETDETARKAGMVAARDFNTIQIIGNKVAKSSKDDAILGELYFYSHTPKPLVDLFPAIHSVDFIPETQVYSITMERRPGLTFSHLLVGRSITEGRLLSFLKALHRIHTSTGPGEATLEIPEVLAKKFASHAPNAPKNSVNIYANYTAKLRSRYYSNKARYDALGPLSAAVFNRLDEFLDTYEAEDKGVEAQVIHGDPVFSNAILSNDGRQVTFIDVRCQLGSTLTSVGDIHYDLAKVLQSLCGYDHVLFMAANNCDLSNTLETMDTPLLDDADVDLLARLREIFFHFLAESYSVSLHRKTLFRITASLLFSLIPLHRPEMGPVFLRMAKETLDKAIGIDMTTTLNGKPNGAKQRA
ncbi:putative phosphatase [Cladorrhinum sp. PSN332]|nr:putative phosphatase [Cladorrhinum sp. PSN332]